jgi:hypothetical protein
MPRSPSSAKKVLDLVLPEYKTPMPSMVKNKVELDSISRARKLAALTPSATCWLQTTTRTATRDKTFVVRGKRSDCFL